MRGFPDGPGWIRTSDRRIMRPLGQPDPSSFFIVRSLSKPCDFGVILGIPSCNQPARYRPMQAFRDDLRERATDCMQKVVGSNPISRFEKACICRPFSCVQSAGCVLHRRAPIGHRRHGVRGRRPGVPRGRLHHRVPARRHERRGRRRAEDGGRRDRRRRRTTRPGDGAAIVAGPGASSTTYATPVMVTQVGGPLSVAAASIRGCRANCWFADHAAPASGHGRHDAGGQKLPSRWQKRKVGASTRSR
jgi:hypothetical protein